jgi:hypothetical protein
VFIVADSHTTFSQTMKLIINQVPHSPDRYVSRQGATGYLTKYSALSGLTAFSIQIDVTAHNVANVMTNEFKNSQPLPATGKPPRRMNVA